MAVISDELQRNISARVVAPIFFMHGEFPDGDVRVCSLGTNFEWNGHEWMGSGHLISIGTLTGTNNLESRKLQVRLSNIPPDLMRKAFIKAPNYPGRIWIGTLDEETGLLSGEPLLLFSGRVDGSSFIDHTQDGALEITYQSTFFNPSAIASHRYNDESHRQQYPGDSTFRFVVGLNDETQHIIWGRSA